MSGILKLPFGPSYPRVSREMKTRPQSRPLRRGRPVKQSSVDFGAGQVYAGRGICD